MHLLLGDHAMVGFIRGQKIIKGSQPPIVVSLQAQRLVHPGAYTLGLSPFDCLLGCSQKFSVDRRREPFLAAHTLMVHLCHICGRSSGASGLADDLGGIFVVAESLIGSGAEPALRRPHGEGDVNDQARLDPDRAAGVLARHFVGERARGLLQGSQPGAEEPQRLLGEAGADMAGVSRPRGPYTPTSRDPIWPALLPSPGFQPPTTTSWRWKFLTFRQSGDRLPGWYGESSRLATMPSRPWARRPPARRRPRSR